MKLALSRYIISILSLFLLFACTSRKTSNLEEIDKLIRSMTLEEKIGQMTQLCLSEITAGNSKTLLFDSIAARKAIVATHIGSFISGTGNQEEWINFNRLLQEIATQESRLKIPLLIGIDHVHGANYIDNGTILPHQLLLSCSFDEKLIAECGMQTAYETKQCGINWNLAPVLDLGINPYWPRFYETFGEDPLVCARMGKSIIGAMQSKDTDGTGMACCGKHFVGYSDPKSGWDRTPAYIPMQYLYEYHLPSFRAAVDIGVMGIMLNSGELNGGPVHASAPIVQGILRNKLNFNGVIITDIKDIMKLVEMHKFTNSEKEATFLALNAGIDISMACSSANFCTYVKELVKEGRITEKRIDESVRRILSLKQKLGLFKKTETTELKKFSPDFILAEKAAASSIVLLKNDSLLPLKRSYKKILVAGIASHSKSLLDGPWSYEWNGSSDARHHEEMLTLYGAVEKEFKSSIVNLLPYLEDWKKNKTEFSKQISSSDIILLTAGESPYSEFKGNINDLAFDSIQDEYIQFVLSFNKPVVLILVEGRPRLISKYVSSTKAVLFAGLPGMGGGPAIAGIISGRHNPSGKLSFTYPAFPSHCVPYYHKPSETYTFLYPFGYGLSYSTFSYSGISVSDTLIIDPEKPVKITFSIKNASKIAGDEIVMLYLQYGSGRYTRPVKILKDFTRISLKAGEEKTVQFSLVPSVQFSYPDENGNPLLDEGNYVLMIGNQVLNIHNQK